MHQPNDIVTPDEIIAFIRQSNVSEEAATGIRLLRRSAETIAWNNSEMNRLEDLQGGVDYEHQFKEAGVVISDALGSPATLSLEGILSAIRELRAYKEQNEQPCDRVGANAMAESSSDDARCADGQTGEVDRHAWAKQATTFAHTVYGFALASDSGHKHRLAEMAQEVIGGSPIK